MNREARIAEKLAAEVNLSLVLGRKYRFVQRLSRHPWFVFEYLGGMSKDRVYREVQRTLEEEQVPYRSIDVRDDGFETHGLSTDFYVIIEKV